MITNTLPQDSIPLDYCFLLLTHVICADQQIHNQEAKALRGLAHDTSVGEQTLLEMEKILGQDENHLSLKEVVLQIPELKRDEALNQVLAIAYVDGYFSPLERIVVDQIAKLWGVSEDDIEQKLEKAQGFSRQSLQTEEKDELSIGAQLLKGAESLLSKALVTKLTELAPEHIGEKVERLQREILLSGPEYDEAIQQCAKIASEDFQYSNKALSRTYQSLRNLGQGLQQTINEIKRKTTGQGQYQTAKEVAKQLDLTKKSLLAEILRDLENVRDALRAKQRTLTHFSIAFMGRTKAGKSTLHAVVTREGWESIGIGKQRTTRYNRVYEWKNIRIIDTPGIGAPGGETDEEIARSVIEEADVICYVVTNNNIQESEFSFLKELKEKTKPLIILLNVQYNLRDSKRLAHFLKNPDRFFSMEGKDSLAGHMERIRRYARQHYANDYFSIVPVMLLAAQLAQEPKHQEHSEKLWKASRIQDFLDSLRVSIVDDGVIRRSQTLLGSTVGSINHPYQWISQQASDYNRLITQLKEKRQELVYKVDQTEKDKKEVLQSKIKEIFASTLDQVRPFAEEHWEDSEERMNNSWKIKLQDLAFETHIKEVINNACNDFQHDLRETLKEIGNELKIINQLQGSKFYFSEQDNHFLDKKFVIIAGMVMGIAGSILAIVFPPLGFLAAATGIAGGIATYLAGRFKSRDQKRHEAVENITTSLKQQLENQEEKIIKQSEENFHKYCQSLLSSADKYFEELIQGLESMAQELETTQKQLLNTSDYLNRAYAKRIVDWVSDKYEPLTDTKILKKVRKVNRDFGKSFHIQMTAPISLNKSEKEISTILQENVKIRPIKSN